MPATTYPRLFLRFNPQPPRYLIPSIHAHNDQARVIVDSLGRKYYWCINDSGANIAAGTAVHITEDEDNWLLHLVPAGRSLSATGIIPSYHVYGEGNTVVFGPVNNGLNGYVRILDNQSKLLPLPSAQGTYQKIITVTAGSGGALVGTESWKDVTAEVDIPEPPATPGTYDLSAVVDNDGNPTYNWTKRS